MPIVLDTQDADEIVETVIRIAPAFGGINLEDIAAPKCFEIERRVIEALNIPVMHDDQHGTAIVVLAGIINAMKVVKKDINKCRVVVSGVGAAGVATIKLLKRYAPKVKIVAVDSVGIIGRDRRDLNSTKKELLQKKIIFSDSKGELIDAIRNADVFLGVSKPGVLTVEMVRTMAPRAWCHRHCGRSAWSRVCQTILPRRLQTHHGCTGKRPV